MTDKIYNTECIPKSVVILERVIEDCLNSMFILSQPSITIQELKKIGKQMSEDEHKQEPLYERHYLPADLYEEIIDQYLDAYGFKSKWHSYVNIIREYFKEGGYTNQKIDKGDVYKLEYIKAPRLEDVIGKEHADKVFELLDLCEDFYSLNHDENVIRVNVMNYAPCCNKDTVEKYWHEHGKPDFKIDDEFYTKEDEDNV